MIRETRDIKLIIVAAIRCFLRDSFFAEGRIEEDAWITADKLKLHDKGSLYEVSRIFCVSAKNVFKIFMRVAQPK